MAINSPKLIGNIYRQWDWVVQEQKIERSHGGAN